MKNTKICVVGLGYVGLPVLTAFAKKVLSVIGYDINERRVRELKDGKDRTNEISKELLTKLDLALTSDPSEIKNSNFVIVCVPTPVDENNNPDLEAMISSSKTVGQNLRKNTVVVYESTVYPGVTEEVCVPVLEKFSGLKYLKDFKVGYSPERINPGDKERTINKVKKIVSGCDEETLERVAEVYSLIIEAGIHKAPNIKTAEAAKVIENIQRDLNIALMNELSIIFSKLGIKTKDVLEAASTKWNFQAYHPGLVGGHCIGIDPYYLTHRAQQLGYDPKVILAGRQINNSMAKYVADLAIEELVDYKKPKVLVMGLTFKENVPDIRNSKAEDVIKELKKHRIEVVACEPLVEGNLFGVENKKFEEINDVDGAILINKHNAFKEITINDLKEKGVKVLVDVKNLFNENEAKEQGIVYKSL